MADEIGEALQKVASAAENSGLSLEKSASWIATISSITRESASTIGRSINSIISRYEQIKSTGFNSEDATKLNDVIKALSDIGITATDSLGQLRPFAEVMDEVGAKFNTLSKNEQAYITTTMFGTFQRNKGLTLLKNYDQSLQNYQTALNSAGQAEQKFSIYQESTAAKMDRLKASLEGVWQSTVNSSVIKGAIDAITDLVDTFGNLNTVLLLAGTALAIWKGSALTSAIAGMKNFSLATSLASSKITLFNEIGFAMQAQAVGAATTIEALSFSFKALGTSIATAFASNPIGWIALIGTALYELHSAISVTSEELRQQVEESYNSTQSNIDNIKRLRDEYNKLAVSKNLSREQKSRLIDIEHELKLKYGETTSNLDLQNKSLEENNKLIDEATKKEAERFKMLNKRAYEEAKDTLNNPYTLNLSGGKSTEYESISKAIADAEKELAESTDKNSIAYNTRKRILEELYKTYDDATNIVSKYESYENLLGNTVNSANKPLNEQKDVIQKYNYNIEESNKGIDETQSSLKSLADLYYQLADGQALSSDQMLDLIQQYPDIIKYMDTEGNLMISQQDLIKTLFELKKQDRIQTLQNEKDKAQAVLDSLEAQRSAYLSFFQALQSNKMSGSVYAGSEKLVAERFGFDKEAYDAALKASQDAQTKINALSKLSFKSYEPKSGTSGRSNAELRQSEALIEKDRYYQLNQELNNTNNLLEKNKALQDNASNKEKLDLMDKEISLLKQKRENIHTIAEEERKERSELVSSLKGQGVKFKGTGDNLSATNASSILDNKLAQVNAHRNDKNKTTYNTLKSQYEELKKSYDRFIEIQVTDLPKAGKEWIGLSGDIDNINLDKISLSFKIFNDSLEPANRQLKELEHQYNMLGENDVAGKEKNINAQLQIKSGLLNDINLKIAEYRKQLSSAKSDKEKDLIQDNIDSLISQAYELEEALVQNTKKANDDKLKLYEDTIDKIKDLLKKQYEQEKKALDDSLNNYRDYINDLIEQRDRLADSEDYQESVNESNTEIARLQAEIDKRKMAALGGDLTSINEIANLQKDKTEEEKKLKDKQKDWERKQTKQNLQDQLKYYEDYTEDQKKLLDEKTTDTALQLEAEKILAQNNITAVQDTINKLFEKTGENASKVGQLVQSELIAKLQQVMDIQKNIDSISAGSSQGTNQNQSSPQNTTDRERSVISQIKELGRQYASTSDIEEKRRLASESLRLGQSIGWSRNSAGYWFDRSGNQVDFNQYAKGTDDVKQISMVGEHGRELRILNPNGKDSIIPNSLTEKLVSFAQNPMGFMNNILPNINTPNLTPIANGGNGNITFGDININGVSKIDRSVLPELRDSIIKAISEKQRLEFNRGGTHRPY